ncbi:oligosaccharide repeat unit polymerase [Mucilaginibacter robiniae]|uniref:Oligosaccharide repeat unit polymerase n=1 Tax=Mucilaginibacter robiniae TaxID=2728022 RepID=A0A7L5E2F5_9SPHI|nr:O-antigen polymerase [Mucilaginibacter robiniae]QJD97560.1 oligosaccharide repeat unit polymerase [Mucilaginibacter robiniae]
MENYDFFYGIIRISPVLMTVDIVLIIAFFVSWYFSYKRTGWLIDFWHFSLFMSYFFTFLLMYPFASAIPNVLTIGERNLALAQRSIDASFFITLTGFLSIFVGGTIFRIYSYKHPINWFLMMPLKLSIGYMTESIIKSKIIPSVLIAIYIALLTFVLLLAFRAGMINNPRGYFLLNEGLRPVFNLTNSIGGIASGLILARIFVFNKRYDKVLFAVFIAATLFIGSRGGAVGPLLGYFTNWIYFRKHGRIKLITLAIAGVGALSLITLLSFFRSGSGGAGILAEIFYGNSFSDVRDLSWVLSLWDGNYFYGKTYLAAFMSFIPSSLSAYRTRWSIGKVTATMAGYSITEHPGIRPGTFGEVYLNFGIIGVIILGILMGYSMRYIDKKIKTAAVTGNNMAVFVAFTAGGFIGSLPITAGFFGFYLNFIIFGVLFLFNLALKHAKQTSEKPTLALNTESSGAVI